MKQEAAGEMRSSAEFYMFVLVVKPPAHLSGYDRLNNGPIALLKVKAADVSFRCAGLNLIKCDYIA